MTSLSVLDSDEVSPPDMQDLVVTEPSVDNPLNFFKILLASVVTGFSFTCPAPLVEDPSGEPLFVIRLDPDSIFKPHTTVGIGAARRNLLLPIQFPYGSWQPGTNFNILSDNYPIFAELLMSMHRFSTGTVQVTLRVTSQTGASGQYVAVVATNVIRNFDSVALTGKYQGYRSFITSRLSAHAMKGFIWGDLSLVRHMTIKNGRPAHGKFRDNAFLRQSLRDSNVPALHGLAQYYPETVAMIYQKGDWFANQAETVTFHVMFDYSDVQFTGPLRPAFFSDSPNLFNFGTGSNEYYTTP